MPAFYGRREGERVFIDGRDASHLARSLRAKTGQEIEVIEPRGLLLTVRLDRVSPSGVEGVVVAEREHRPEPEPKVTIAIALLPSSALEQVLAHCTEAGAYEFVVFAADRSVARAEKIARWKTICREAAMLSRRLRVPGVAVAPSVQDVIAAFENPVMLVRDAEVRLADLREPRDVTLLIGPEGGWTERELALAETTATLGPRNLRAETAALSALSIALAARGD